MKGTGLIFPAYSVIPTPSAIIGPLDSISSVIAAAPDRQWLSTFNPA